MNLIKIYSVAHLKEDYLHKSIKICTYKQRIIFFGLKSKLTG